MITNMRITNDRGVSVDFPLDVLATNSRYSVRDIQGLGPTKSDLVRNKSTRIRGSRYQRSLLLERNIVLRLGFNPMYTGSETVQKLRQALYRLLPTGGKVTLRFDSTDLEPVIIDGYVESADPAIFSAEPEIQVSILCPDPLFRGLAPIVVASAGTAAMIIDYQGDVATGFQVVWTPVNASGRVTVTHAERDEVFRFTNTRGSNAVDIYTVNTDVGSRKLMRDRSGVVTSALTDIDPVSVWPSLHPGLNRIVAIGAGPARAFTLTYTRMFGGI